MLGPFFAPPGFLLNGAVVAGGCGHDRGHLHQACRDLGKLLHQFAHGRLAPVAACLPDAGQNLIEHPLLEPLGGGQLAVRDQPVQVALRDEVHLNYLPRILRGGLPVLGSPCNAGDYKDF